jgi:hypothetical protein
MPKNSKNNLYKNEQEAIKDKILNLLKIDTEKKYFILYELDNDINKQNEILSLENDCDKYFATSRWTYFMNKREGKINDRPYLLLIRNILSACDVDFISKTIQIPINDKKIFTVKYFIL